MLQNHEIPLEEWFSLEYFLSRNTKISSKSVGNVNKNLS